MYFTHHYVIDWSKVRTIADIKRILNVVDISFSEDCVAMKDIIDLVKREPIPTSTRGILN